MGIINRSDQWPGIRVRTVRGLRAEQSAHRDMTGYVVGSQYMADQLAIHGMPPAKTHVLPLFADPTVSNEEAERDPCELLFVGQIVRGKGLDLLVDSLVDVDPRIRLTVVGGGAQEEEVRRQVQDLRLQDRVRFVGRKSHQEVCDHYRTAGCLVIPSRSPETFAQVGVEAMSYGLPSIATDVGGISQWLSDGENGLLCPPNSPDALAAAIRRFASDASFAATLGRKARRSYEENFQPQGHLDGLEKLFRQTASLGEVKS